MSSINRSLLDNWSTRENLCLASAVSSSGDQNWMTVSRNIKVLNETNNRPADWFSQKSCALQYAHLLENIETPKRKKRTSEGTASPATIVETPTDSVLRRLTEERIQELKTEIRKEQEEYAKIYAELQKIQSPQFNEEMLREMWREIEKEQEAQRIAEMKIENQLREREQRRLEMQRSWRLGVKPQENTAVVDMDVEEIIGVAKLTATQQQQPTATSPLLSSLLKSPTATTPPTLNTATSARTNAPTITTLLTSGSIPHTNQPAIVLNTNLIPPEKAVQLLTRPISGPPAVDSINVPNIGAQNLLSPSQSAPTLSMLLERNKVAANNQSNTNQPVSNVEAPTNIGSNKDMQHVETGEDKTIIVTETSADSEDPNEEQQLLEVFKNIGNIDELDIDVSVMDEEVDFLKGVDESPTNETIDFTGKLEATEKLTTQSEQSGDVINAEFTTKDELKKEDKIENEIKPEIIKIETSSDDSNDNIPLSTVATLEHKERSLNTPIAETNVEDSNENNFLKDKVESVTPKNNETKIIPTDESKTLPIKLESTKIITIENLNEQKSENQKSVIKNENKEEANVKNPNTEEDTELNISQSKPTEDEQSERFSTPTGLMEAESAKSNLTKDEDNKSDAQNDDDNDVESSTSNAAPTIDEPSHESNSNNDGNTSTIPLPPPSIISIADTDEDSCTTDISIITPKRQEQSTPVTSASKQTGEKSRKTSSHDAAAKSTDDSDSGSTNRASKRSLLSILSNLTSSKSAQTIQRALNDDQLKNKYQKVCYRRLDFPTIKKSIENGTIRSTIELQRDLLLITQNVYVLFPTTNATYKAAEVFKHEMQNIREFVFNSHEFETKSEKEVRDIKQAAKQEVKQIRTGSRKSQRIA